jgi:DNA-binding NtrC family response regulator
MEKRKILVVDDNELFRDSIADTLIRLGFDITQAPDGMKALEIVSKNAFDLAISDMKMPGMTGIELLEKIKQHDPDMPFLIITAFGAVETAVEAMKKGAYDFIQKSGSLMRELELTVIRALQYKTLLNENKQLKSALTKKWSYIGTTPAMDEVRALVMKVADSRATVLVTGESGTGKELVARSIHLNSRRNNGPFVKVNCAAMPEGLVESELFGHEKGAFTGAIMQKRGKFEAASGGTLLLDEIGEMPLPAQAKLLRVLQEHEINKVGGDEPIEVDVRIVVTTNRKLEEEVAKGNFREDLYYRLNVLRIHLPPLRDRKEDIPALVDHFLRNCNEDNGFSVEGLDAECMPLLQK